MNRPREVTLEGAAGTLRGSLWEAPSQSGTVILLHGGGQTHRTWNAVGPRVVECGWSALAYDARGHGDSAWAPDGDYSLAALAEDLRLVAGNLNGPTALVGASIGGHTAIVAQDRNPDLAIGIALVDVVPQMAAEGVERVLGFMAAHKDGFDSPAAAGAAVARFKADLTDCGPRPGIHKHLRLDHDGRWRWHWDPRFLTHAYRPGTAQALELEDAARRLEIPVTLLAGEYSDLVPASRIEAFRQLVPHVETKVVRGADHMVAGDDGGPYLNHIVSFVDQVAVRT